MRVLLVNPTLTSVYNPFPFPPLGLMVLAANIHSKHKVVILDRNSENENGYANLTMTIKRLKPDLVGVTSLTGKGIIDGLEVSKIAQENKIKVVWGGTHASLFPQQTLQSSLIDLVVIGEGEITFRMLLNALEYNRPLRGIAGLGYKLKGKIIINPEREFIDNLNNYPMPAWDLVDVERYIFPFKQAKRKIEIVTSRGCPYRCAFCYNLKFNKRRWRGKSAKKIIEEISFLKKHYKIDSVRFADDLFTVDKKRVKEFCELNKNKTKITWDANCRVNDINKNFLGAVVKGGCSRLTIGVESGSGRMLQFLKKDITVQQAIKAFDLLSKTKIMTSAAFMIGLPTETLKEAKKTIRLAKKIKASHVNLYPYVPYPGGELSEYCIKKGLIRYPETIVEWKNYSYTQQRAGSLSTREINRLVFYFQLRNFFNSLRRGEWGLLKNFFSKRGIRVFQQALQTLSDTR